ncbi:hypothetical protein N7509_008247, partial [Penicillium cosmopolitanum]
SLSTLLPLNNTAITPGAVVIVPKTTQSSSDEGSQYSPYHGQRIKLEELEAAVQSIKQRKESSPERMGPADKLETEARSSSSQPSPAQKVKLNHWRPSEDSRKITHARSFTEIAMEELKGEGALTGDPDNRDAQLPKPPMVRKKSGELVQPILRLTPHSEDSGRWQGSAIRLSLDRPLAVSAETSPVHSHDADREFPFGQDEDELTSEWEWELQLSNFPKDMSSRATNPVCLEKLFLSADKNVLIGSVTVANLAFHKYVAAHFTFDYWRTVSEVGAVFCHDVRCKHAHDEYDRFSFEIKLNDQTNLESNIMFVCIRYNVNGQEFWDNNNGMNFRVDFLKSPKTTASKSSGGDRTSMNSSHTAHLHSDDSPHITKNTPFSNPFAATKETSLSGTSSDDIDTAELPKRCENPHRQAFRNRYDFGASLAAAMRTKSPLDRTTLTARERSEHTSDVATPRMAERDLKTTPAQASPVSDAARKEDLEPFSLVSSKPCLESSLYNELVDKYCFKPQSSAVNGEEPSKDSENFASSALSPLLSPLSLAPVTPLATETPRESHPSSLSPSFLSASLIPRASPQASPSPMLFRYNYLQPWQNGFPKDPRSLPAIRG